MNQYRFFNQDLTVCTSKLTFLSNSSGTVDAYYQPISNPVTLQGDYRHLRPCSQSEREGYRPKPAET